VSFPEEAWFVSVKEDGSLDRNWGGDCEEAGETPQELLMGDGTRIVKVMPVSEARQPLDRIADAITACREIENDRHDETVLVGDPTTSQAAQVAVSTAESIRHVLEAL